MRISDWSSDVCSSDLTTGDRRILTIGTADGVAQIQQNLGNAAHARAAYTHKMYALNSMFHACLLATCSPASAICPVAFSQACSWACSAPRASPARLLVRKGAG